MNLQFYCAALRNKTVNPLPVLYGYISKLSYLTSPEVINKYHLRFKKANRKIYSDLPMTPHNYHNIGAFRTALRSENSWSFLLYLSQILADRKIGHEGNIEFNDVFHGGF